MGDGALMVAVDFLLTANFLYLFIAPQGLQAHELIDGFVVVHVGSDAIAVKVVEGELVLGVPRGDSGSEILVGGDVLDASVAVLDGGHAAVHARGVDCFGTLDPDERGGDSTSWASVTLAGWYCSMSAVRRRLNSQASSPRRGARMDTQARPWRRALRLLRCFPSTVRGPVDFRAF